MIYKKQFNALSPVEQQNWIQWKTRMIKDIEKIPVEAPTYLQSKLRKGIQQLKDLEFVVKLADKNLGMVAIRGDIYNSMISNHLKWPAFQRVPHFPKDDIIRRLTNILTTSNTIPERERNSVLKYANEQHEPCPFYISPKLHKKKLGSRPITAQHSYILAPLSRKLAKRLQILVDSIPEIGKDSKTIVQKLEDLRLLKPCVFLTYDVEQLYPSIDINDAIEVLRENIPSMRMDRGIWTKVLQLIMYNNYVEADGKIYRQLRGTATGTQVAPPFANLYLYYKLKKVLSHSGIQFQNRFIDDGFIIADNIQVAEQIVRNLNQVCNLKFTAEINPSRAIYLDICIYKGPRYELSRKLDLKVYFKPTNRMLYLPSISNHPGSQKTGIVKGEAIRCLRNTTSKAQWLASLRIIFQGLILRGYSGKMIKQKWKTIRFENRERYIFSTPAQKQSLNKIVLTRYNNKTRWLWRKLIAKHSLKTVLISRKLNWWNKKQEKIIENWPPSIVFKDFHKLGTRIVSAKQAWKYPHNRR